MRIINNCFMGNMKRTHTLTLNLLYSLRSIRSTVLIVEMFNFTWKIRTQLYKHYAKDSGYVTGFEYPLGKVEKNNKNKIKACHTIAHKSGLLVRLSHQMLLALVIYVTWSSLPAHAHNTTQSHTIMDISAMMPYASVGAIHHTFSIFPNGKGLLCKKPWLCGIFRKYQFYHLHYPMWRGRGRGGIHTHTIWTK